MLGKPGSVQRWILGTLIWLFACLLLSLYVGWLARIVLFLFAVLVPVAAFRARSLAVGDEDEVRAAVRHVVRESSTESTSDQDEVRLDPADWLSRRPRLFDDVPPPPIVDGELEPSGGRDASGSDEPADRADCQ